MSGKLQFRRGLKSNLPASAPSGMPLWCEDTKELYVRIEDGVAKILPIYEMEELTQKQSLTNIPLENNSVNFIVPDRKIIFELPEINDNFSSFSQIFVQLGLQTAQTIDLGTEYFFNNEIPDLSKSGLYDIMYEFSPIENRWYCGVLTQRITE